MKKTVVILALIVGAILPVTAQADFRTGNTWEATPRAVQHGIMQDNRTFYGDVLHSGRHRVTFVLCKGDATGNYTVNRAHGWYHHLYCAARLEGTPYWASFQTWVVGEQISNYRITNVTYVR